MSTLSKILKHPIVILFMFLIGFWNVFFPSENWNIYVGIFIIVMTIFNLRKYIKSRSIKPTCEYCGFIASDERELNKHQLTCEKKERKF